MKIPFFKKLENAQNILIAGAGGGFDIVSGIPIYLYLRSLGKTVVLANLSFTELAFTDSCEICPGTYQVTAQSGEVPYFPEKFILEWLATRNDSPAMYGFSNKLGVTSLRNAYKTIIERHQIDTLILVDGGTDSLIFGDEPGVGTVVEDACSMVAAAGVSPEQSFLVAIGFGIDHFHDVNHHACLENISTLMRDGAYLGAFSLTQEMPEGKGYLELVDYLNDRLVTQKSIVTNSIANAMRGAFGNVHATPRTKYSELFINPLMALFWTFSLSGVVNRMLFAKEIESTQTMDAVAREFRYFRSTVIRRARKAIPL
jgi:hypothetical protein